MSVCYTSGSMYDILIPQTSQIRNLQEQKSQDPKYAILEQTIQSYIQEIHMIQNRNINSIKYLERGMEKYKRDYFLYDSYLNNIIEEIIETDKLIHKKWDILIIKINKIKHCPKITPYINIKSIREELLLILNIRDIYAFTLKHIVYFIKTEDSVKLTF